MPTDDWLTGTARHEAALARIHAAAREVLVERGPVSFSADLVARRAGCSRATLYRVAGGKQALLRDLLEAEAATWSRQVAAGLGDLGGAERVVEAIRLGLAAVRAHAVVHDWVRATAASSDYLHRSPALVARATEWLGDTDAPPLAGEWIVRVFLQLVVWPEHDAEAERHLLRTFVGPAFGDPTTPTGV